MLLHGEQRWLSPGSGLKLPTGHAAQVALEARLAWWPALQHTQRRRARAPPASHTRQLAAHWVVKADALTPDLCLRGIATPRLGRAMVGRHTVRVILHYNNQQVHCTA
ncbi:hypothetical protein OEZ86_005069 [Tetradesmus obliquus]|nr:hypothetical protein OEZ86_005069 [Tetradesmus obliquus]